MISIKLRRNAKYVQVSIESYDQLLDTAELLEMRKDLIEAIDDINSHIEYIKRFYKDDLK